MEAYLPTIWGFVIAFAITMYVILDGFDLGVAILFPFTHDEEERDQMMNSVAPFWDGNETWLVLGGGGLFVAFPTAYAIIMPAMYIPVIVMLLALIFRGVAFEFRFVAKPRQRKWDLAFSLGSIVAAFCQGLVLGGVLDGIEVADGRFAGGPFDFLSPFAIICGFGLVAGYALLGAGWLMMRTSGRLRYEAGRWAIPALALMLAFIALVSIWTPLTTSYVAERWFSSPQIWYLWPVPFLTLVFAVIAVFGILNDNGVQTFLASVALYLLCFLGLAISVFPYIVPPTVTLTQAAAAPESQVFVLIGVVALTPIILFYTGFVYWTFRGRVRPGEGYH